MRRYAAAWGIGIGWAIGGLIGIPLHAFVELSMTGLLVGLIVGSVIAQGVQKASAPQGPVSSASVSERLKQVEKLRTESLISDAEYQSKRKQILDDV